MAWAPPTDSEAEHSPTCLRSGAGGAASSAEATAGPAQRQPTDYGLAASGLAHLRYQQATESTRDKSTLRAKRRGELGGAADAVLEPLERLLVELTPKELQAAPTESSRQLHARMSAAVRVVLMARLACWWLAD